MRASVTEKWATRRDMIGEVDSYPENTGLSKARRTRPQPKMLVP